MPSLGQGSTVSYASTQVERVKSIELPSLEFKTVDVTHLLSAGPVKDSIPSFFAEATKMTVTSYFTPSSWTALNAQLGVIQTWTTVVHTPGSGNDRTYSFPGFLAKVGIKVADADEPNMIDSEVMMTGAPTLS